MGPRLISRGKGRQVEGECPYNSSFNGAAADQPRKDRQGDQVSPSEARFNGAAADQPRKALDAGGRGPRLMASMGPRLISRGKSACSHDMIASG